MKGGTGDGPECLIVPAHGASIVLGSGTAWCPDQSHDQEPMSPSLIPRQQAWLDKQAAKAKVDEPEVEAVAG